MDLCKIKLNQSDFNCYVYIGNQRNTEQTENIQPNITRDASQESSVQSQQQEEHKTQEAPGVCVCCYARV